MSVDEESEANHLPALLLERLGEISEVTAIYKERAIAILGLKSYIEESHGYEVEVTPVYLDGKSDLVGRKFVFAYHIRIENKKGEKAQLLRRHWYINEKGGREWEVEGEGVIGEQPILEPGQEHNYQSFCVIETFEGWMHGSYLMQPEDGESFEILVPKFDMKARVN